MPATASDRGFLDGFAYASRYCFPTRLFPFGSRLALSIAADRAKTKYSDPYLDAFNAGVVAGVFSGFGV